MAGVVFRSVVAKLYFSESVPNGFGPVQAGFLCVVGFVINSPCDTQNGARSPIAASASSWEFSAIPLSRCQYSLTVWPNRIGVAGPFRADVQVVNFFAVFQEVVVSFVLRSPIPVHPIRPLRHFPSRFKIR